MAEVFSIGMLLLGLEPIMVRSQSIFHLGENSQGANGGNRSLDRIFRTSHSFQGVRTKTRWQLIRMHSRDSADGS